MSLSLRSRLLVLVCSSFALFGIVVADWARAQAGAAQLGNSAAIEKDFKLAKGRLQEIMSGPAAKTYPADVLDTAAKYYVYRVTWPSVLDAKAEPGRTEPLMLVVKDFHDHVAKVKAADPALANAYSPVLLDRFRELTDLPVEGNARAIVHGMQMLPGLARLQHDKVSKYLVELLDPKMGKHDIIKLGAIRALREFMPVDAWINDVDPSLLQDKFKLARKAGDLERIEALTNFILRPPTYRPLPEKATPAELDAHQTELDAYRYLRREALETLALAGAPAVAAFGKNQAVQGPIAPLLVRALMPGGLTPDTNLHEKNEAALGLCIMSVPNGYDPAPGYHFVGATLVDLAKDYSEDWANIKNKTLPSRFPWKITAKRWDSALKQLAANAKNAPQADKSKAETLEKTGRAIMDKILVTDAVNANPFRQALASIVPPKDKFFVFRPTLKSDPLTMKAAPE